MDSYQIALIAITFGAAIVNGALGYGFSSITVPLALLFLTNRVLNPALVPIEVALNAYVLWVNRAALPKACGGVSCPSSSDCCRASCSAPRWCRRSIPAG